MALEPRLHSSDPGPLNRYEYKDLGEYDSLRILRVDPGRAKEILGGQLQHWGKRKIAEIGYEALSYCWGNGNNDYSSIRVLDGNTFEIPISEHLHEALLALRHRDRPRYLWIDAVCINQENNRERNKQVSKMDETYGNADNVCIWLGKGTAGSDQALDFIRDQVLEVERFDKLRASPESIEKWTALLGLMKRDWFQRRWIVQEVSLARKATLHCGGKTIDWKQFASAVSLLADVDYTAPTLSKMERDDEKTREINNAFGEVHDLGATALVNVTERLFKRSATGVSQRTSTLEEIVARLATFRTSEPRDTIYALLALANDSNPSINTPDRLYGRAFTDRDKGILQAVSRPLGNPYKPKFYVNYNQRVVDVYQEFIKFALARSRSNKGLDIICRPFASSFTYEEDVGFSNKLKSKFLTPFNKNEIVPMPSWIPKVSEMSVSNQSRPMVGEVYRVAQQRGSLFISTPDRLPYSAAGFRTHDPRNIRFRRREFEDTTKDHYSMYLEGFVLTEVTNRLETSQDGFIPLEWVVVGKQYQRKDSDIFWRTLVADRGPAGPAPLFYKNVIEAFLEKATPGVILSIQRHVKTRRSEIISQVLNRMQTTVHNRSLIEAKQQLLGLAPRETLPGDLICILHGCTVPVVMRKFPKDPEDVENERRFDEEDRLERRWRAESILRVFFERKKKWLRRHDRSAYRTQSTSLYRTRARLSTSILRSSIARTRKSLATFWYSRRAQKVSRINSWPVLRTIILFLGALSMRWLSAEYLAASILAFIAVPHILLIGDVFTANQMGLRLVASSTLIFLFRISNTAESLSLTSCSLIILPFFDFFFADALSQAYKKHRIKLVNASLHEQNRAKERKTKSDERRRSPLDENCYYQLIGECYVHNMMNGEAIVWQNESFNDEGDKVLTETFELR